tara:strand:+ start:875 stop:1489 length:615 start_codon:yes stop_codon:yes gene_type:complete
MKITLVKDGQSVKRYIPQHWNELTMKQYMGCMKILKDQSVKKELEKVVKMLSVITEIDEVDIYRLPVKNINTLGLKLTKFLGTKPSEELQHLVTINDVEYGFHPKLSDMTFGEWIDIDNYINAGVDDNLHKIMSVLYRPIIAKQKNGKYAIEPYEPSEEKQNTIKDNLTVKEFNGVSVFFSDLGRELLMTTLKSSIQLLKDKKD